MAGSPALLKRITGCAIACVVVGAIATTSPASAQQAPAFVFVGIAGDAQTVPVGHVFPIQFAVRLTDTVGTPLPGAPVNFQNVHCYVATGVPCDVPGDPGHFESGNDNATVVTDASGIAIAPPYYAGGGPGATGILAFVLPHTPPYNFGTSQSLNDLVVFHLQQVAAAPVGAPTLSGLSSLLLGLAVGIAGFLVARQDAGRVRVARANRARIADDPESFSFAALPDRGLADPDPHRFGKDQNRCGLGLQLTSTDPHHPASELERPSVKLQHCRNFPDRHSP